MPAWTSVGAHPTQGGRTFQRPLRGFECPFFWDGQFSGIADNLYHVELRLLGVSQDTRLFSEANIAKAWLSTKRRYPLSGATVQMLPESAGSDGISLPTFEPHFVVREHDLVVLRPHEITFGLVACAEEIPQHISAIWEGPRPLSNELLAKLYVFRETESRRTNVLHLITLMAHCVTDGMANRTFMRCLLDTLARGGDSGSELAQVSLEDRLAMAISYEDLGPVHLRSLSPARLRWRRAIVAVIVRSRIANTKGGHTLPCRITRTTSHNPSRPGFIYSLLTQEQTTSAVANCRFHGLTFGSAYSTLAQVAMTRVLYRRYLCGEISEEEWTYRKRQPYQIGGPFNLRPFLDKQWFENGGGGEFVVSMSVFFNSLPFMTLGETEHPQYHKSILPDGAPPFSDLLTFDRFLHRAGLAKKKTKAFLDIDHPLFFEFTRAYDLIIGYYRRSALEHAKKQSETVNDEAALAVTDIPIAFAHFVSTLGNVHLISPTEYPLSSTHSLSPSSGIPHPARAGYITAPLATKEDLAPRLVVENSTTRVHTHPAELYLGALTSGGQLNMYVSYDANVYEEEVVREWLDEVRGAVLWYLGQTHMSRRVDG